MSAMSCGLVMLATVAISVASAARFSAAAAAAAAAPDMFADDMFDDKAEERAAARNTRVGGADGGPGGGAADMTAGLSDNWDDADGYYRARMAGWRTITSSIQLPHIARKRLVTPTTL